MMQRRGAGDLCTCIPAVNSGYEVVAAMSRVNMECKAQIEKCMLPDAFGSRKDRKNNP